MEERIQMNTESLQKQFKDVYEQFFAKNDLVVSANHSLPWTLGFWWDKDKMHIKQKVWLKTFVGITIVNEPIVKFENVRIFEVGLGKFDSIAFMDINKQYRDIEKKVLEVLNKMWYEKWMVINILSESPRWYGLWFSWLVGTLLATVVFLLTKRISSKDIDAYDDFVASDVFQDIFSLAWEIDYISKYHNSAGHNCYAAMMNTSLPTVTFCEEYDMKDQFSGRRTNNYKIKDFLGVTNELEELNLDYGVIFSWIKNKVENNNKIFMNSEKEFDILQEHIVEIFKKNSLKKLDKFSFKNVFKEGFLKMVWDAFFVYNFKLLKAFKDLLERWFDDAIVHDFIQTIKENNILWSLFETDNRIFSSMFRRFDYFKKFDDEILGIFPISTTKIGGSFVFVMKPHKSRNTIMKTIEKLQEIWYTNLRLEYASWLDGTSSDGVRIDQWIDAGIFSKYVQKDQVYYKDSMWESFIGDYNDVLTKNKEGLLLDMIHNKIYLNWRKLSSKDLLSQTTTIEILYRLMENIGQDIRNKEFEISSYSKNKNEMLGKIVIPLIGLIEKETGERIPLICKGSIYDFYMKLNPSILKIAVIKKI